MKITFNGHSQAQRQTELTEKQLKEIFELLKYALITHIEYTSAFDREAYYEENKDKVIREICNAHSVDVEYKKDRIAFFKAILDGMENPYQ